MPKIKHDNYAKAIQAAGMTPVKINADGFVLTSYQRIKSVDSDIRIYIEGDGFAWVNRTEPSSDPTPRHAVGLSLALADLSPNVVYLARPCQYSLAQSPRCNPTYWTDKRFSEEVIEAMSHAVDRIMLNAPGKKAELIGYSGGAAVAVLLAARRSDIENLRTVAGNLDHEAVNRIHRVSQMPDSLNPIDVAYLLKGLPQVHFCGLKDQVVPTDITREFALQVGPCSKLIELPDLTHEAGWTNAWPHLLKITPRCY